PEGRERTARTYSLAVVPNPRRELYTVTELVPLAPVAGSRAHAFTERSSIRSRSSTSPTCGACGTTNTCSPRDLDAPTDAVDPAEGQRLVHRLRPHDAGEARALPVEADQ